MRHHNYPAMEARVPTTEDYKEKADEALSKCLPALKIGRVEQDGRGDVFVLEHVNGFDMRLVLAPTVFGDRLALYRWPQGWRVESEDGHVYGYGFTADEAVADFAANLAAIFKGLSLAFGTSRSLCEMRLARALVNDASLVAVERVDDNPDCDHAKHTLENGPRGFTCLGCGQVVDMVALRDKLRAREAGGPL